MLVQTLNQVLKIFNYLRNKLGLNYLLLIIYYGSILILYTVHFKRLINFILRIICKKFNRYKYFIIFFILSLN